MNVKQIIIIRKDLKMRRGKENSQAAHASIAWLTKRINLPGTLIVPTNTDGAIYNNIWFSAAESEWMAGSFAKITLQVNSEQELYDIYKRAKAAGLETHIIIDSGKTEFDGIPTPTTVGIGPDEDYKFIGITDNLKLY